MEAIEKLEAAIAKLEKMQSSSTVGGWVAMESRRGIAGFDGLLDAVVEEGHVLPWDADLIVTLHRTVPAQLAILRSGLEWLHEFELDAPTYTDGRPMSATRLFKVTSQGRATFALADAILGGA